MEINNIIQVQISRQTQAIAQASFDIPLIIGANKATSGMSTYTSIDAVADDFDTADPEYKMAQKIFSRSPHVNEIKIWREEGGDIDDEIVLANQADNEWYVLLTETESESDILLAAAQIEAMRKLFIARTNDSAVKGSGSGDIASQLKAAGYDRTAVFYKSTITDYPDAAWAGYLLTFEPGEETWAYKSLNGVTVDTLTDSEISYLDGKNCNYYISLGGVSITLTGKVASGEWIDIIRGVDWLTARMEERIYSKLVNVAKIPFTNKGIGIIEAEVRAQIEEGGRQGVIDLAQEYTVSVPDVADVSAIDKANRLLPDVTFSAKLQGAIHKMQIDGIVRL